MYTNIFVVLAMLKKQKESWTIIFHYSESNFKSNKKNEHEPINPKTLNDIYPTVIKSLR